MTRYTSEQSAFIDHQHGNALCIAGAGTGKTTTLVGLIEQKLATIPAQEMLVLMFNRDIRTDFQAKLRDSGIQAQVPVHTFHSFCLKFLNQTGFIRNTGYRVDYQSGESDKALVKAILRELSGLEKTYQRQQMIKDPKTIELLLSFIGLVKAYMLSPHEVFKIAEINRDYLFILDAYEQFETLRKKQRLLFFDDWLVETVKLLESDDAIRAHFHQHCKLVVVDEFQDINTAQYRLLKQLLGPQTQLLAVGDVDQCIYKWRGSAPQFMLNFEQDFAPAKTYTLSQTFRFGHSLALAASHLIANNKERFSEFLTVSGEGISDTQIVECGSSRQVGEIANAISQYLAEGGQPSDVAILVRRWSQTLLFELAFLSKQLPYQMPVPSVLAHSREVKLLMELATLATPRFSELAVAQKASLLFSLMCFPHCYVPNKSLKPLCEQLAGMEPSQWLTFIGRYEKANATLKLDNLIERLALLTRLMRKGSFKAAEVYQQYRNESGLDSWIWKTEATASEIEEAVERLDSVATVLEAMDQSCEKALQYFEYYTQQSGQKSANTNAGSKEPDAQNALQLTTIFRAKGCEYHHVHLPFWDKDAFPYVNRTSGTVGADLEEERRLAYVALTRAKQKAFVYYTMPDKPSVKATNASRFVLEGKINLAQDLGPKLYQQGTLPYYSSPVAEEYCRRMGREQDVAEPPVKKTKKLPSAKAVRISGGKQTDAGLSSGNEYSYKWAMQQPLPDNAEKVIRAMVKTKNAKYLDGEINRIIRELPSVSETKKKVLVNRLIVAANARSLVRR
ncbi:ATP-dependent helicase [Photobacterium sp. DA100]|uniref:ATP-dependent helicase n=1 Tax=Photobacterium sp. DA100 TaxID=3027472 RepID=UPI00247AF113|nr:ATP-dependent helicase [Photobacterium sp. DA100]WEM43583.1 ATP-dependent helicase [Photobacterium sp. DA100]